MKSLFIILVLQEQASWVCQCPVNMVTTLEADFKRTLQRQASLEQWAAWLEATVCRALRPHENSSNYAHHARQFLLKWSFYRLFSIFLIDSKSVLLLIYNHFSSMVIRDLTLRSAASFGSFHLIRLLYDEYMFYLIEHRVAAHRGSAPIQVMSEVNLFLYKAGFIVCVNFLLYPNLQYLQKDLMNGSSDSEEQHNPDLLLFKIENDSPTPPKKIKKS